MTQLVSFSVRDAFEDPTVPDKTWYYSKEYIADHRMSTWEMVNSITLLDRTARTNVILRDASGRFISYKKVVPEGVGAAVASLKPFPTV